MKINKNRILIFGAGVIGRVYAIKFIEAGFDVTLFARGDKYGEIKEHGIRYDVKGEIRSAKVNVINNLADDDIYDYIFVCVRYDQSLSALEALKSNKSKNIVTMANNSAGLSVWQDIVGDRLMAGFPAAGGQIEDGILHALFPPKAFLKTMIGEVDGKVSQRLTNLCEIFKIAKLPYTIDTDMNAFLITHSVMNIALVGVLHEGGTVMDASTAKTKATARKVTLELKSHLRSMKELNIAITPSMFKLLLACPSFIVDLIFMIVLRTKTVKNIMLSDYASGATNEIVELQRDFLVMLQEKRG